MQHSFDILASGIFINGSSSISGDTATITLNANLKGTWQCRLDGGAPQSCMCELFVTFLLYGFFI